MQAANLDPTPIFDLFRGNHATELLTAAVSHFDVFGKLAKGPLDFEALRAELGLEERPAHVLITGLRAMKLIEVDANGRDSATPLGSSFLVPGSTFDVGGYLGLAAQAPGVVGLSSA